MSVLAPLRAYKNPALSPSFPLFSLPTRCYHWLFSYSTTIPPRASPSRPPPPFPSYHPLFSLFARRLFSACVAYENSHRMMFGPLEAQAFFALHRSRYACGPTSLLPFHECSCSRNLLEKRICVPVTSCNWRPRVREAHALRIATAWVPGGRAKGNG
ncbi:hypothetical protein EJ03DRAFT_71429 [Teratosphaeria nubilosa]|uniref:Uncharacterized protein n=1 Tax=Teratosphaeria nubilosa TaxID=161662 RepID=A0A6G1LM06_9PEZI|nr:hypothetical protein EJ03DRAFT_71429 [Teratosphaeria nubilosa]